MTRLPRMPRGSSAHREDRATCRSGGRRAWGSSLTRKKAISSAGKASGSSRASAGLRLNRLAPGCAALGVDPVSTDAQLRVDAIGRAPSRWRQEADGLGTRVAIKGAAAAAAPHDDEDAPSVGGNQLRGQHTAQHEPRGIHRRSARRRWPRRSGVLAAMHGAATRRPRRGGDERIALNVPSNRRRR